MRIFSTFGGVLENLKLSLSCKKGMSHVVWILVAAAVLMVVALGVIFVFESGFGEFGDWVDSGIDDPCDQVDGDVECED